MAYLSLYGRQYSVYTYNASNREEEIFAIIRKENNGRERWGWVPTLSKSRKEQNGGPRAPLEL